MPLIDLTGRQVATTYRLAEESAEPTPGAIVSLARLLATAEPPRPLGVVLQPGDRLDALLPYLNRLDLICVAFPKFRDGRGFSTARALRDRHGFKGEIRATGHVLPDQAHALAACGVTTIETPATHPPAQWQAFLAHPDATPRQLLNRMMTRAASVQVAQ